VSTGKFNVAPGAELLFAAGAHTLSGAASLNGAGLFDLSIDLSISAALTLTLNTNQSIAHFTMSSGTLNGPATMTVTKNLTWTGGDLDGDGVTDVASTGTLTILGSSAKELSNSHVLNNAGTATWTGSGSIQLYGDGTFDNSGVFNDNTSSTFDGGGPFNNSGTFAIASTTGTTYIGHYQLSALNNSGTVNVNSGTLELDGNDTSTGKFNVASGAELLFAGNTHRLNSGATFLGSGTIAMSGGTVVVNTSSIAAPDFAVNGGTLVVPARDALTVSGLFIVGAGGTLNIQIGGTSSSPTIGQVIATGTGMVDLNGNLSVTTTVAPAIGSKLTLLKNLGSGVIGGTLAGLSEGAKINVNGIVFAISYMGANGKSVVVTRLS